VRQGIPGTDPPEQTLLDTSVNCLPGSIDAATAATSEICNSIKCRGLKADMSEDR